MLAASAFLVSIPWEAYHIMVVPYLTIIELNYKHLKYFRMLPIDCTAKLTAHVILHNLNNFLRTLGISGARLLKILNLRCIFEWYLLKLC